MVGTPYVKVLINYTSSGEIRYEQFIQFLDSDDQEEQGHSAFQVILSYLSRDTTVIVT